MFICIEKQTLLRNKNWEWTDIAGNRVKYGQISLNFVFIYSILI